MKNKNIVISVAVVLVSILALFAFKPSASSVRFGGTTNLDVLAVNELDAAGPINASSTAVTGVGYFGNGVQEGGLATSATASTTVNLTAAQIASSSVIAIVASSSATTVNFPASSTLTTFLPNAGDMTQLVIWSSSSTASTITFAGGTGTTLQKATSSALIIGGDSAIFRVYRQATGGNFNIVMMGTAR